MKTTAKSTITRAAGNTQSFASLPKGRRGVKPTAVATNIDKAERNRPAHAAEGPEQEEAVAGLVRGALSEQLAKGVTPQAMAEQTLQAIRAKRFYIFTEGMDDSEQWKGNIELRLDDIRLGRNPTFPSFS